VSNEFITREGPVSEARTATNVSRTCKSSWDLKLAKLSAVRTKLSVGFETIGKVSGNYFSLWKILPRQSLEKFPLKYGRTSWYDLWCTWLSMNRWCSAVWWSKTITLLPPKIAKSRENPIKFDLTAVQGHPRSSILVSMESPCDFILVINCNFSRICYRFWRHSRLKIENCWFYPPLPCLTPPLGWNPLEFLDETYPAET